MSSIYRKIGIQDSHIQHLVDGFDVAAMPSVQTPLGLQHVGSALSYQVCFYLKLHFSLRKNAQWLTYIQIFHREVKHETIFQISDVFILN